MVENVTGEIKNPLVGIDREDLLADVEKFAERHDLMDHIELLRKGALIAQNPADFENMDELNEEDRDCLRVEITRRWKHPWIL